MTFIEMGRLQNFDTLKLPVGYRFCPTDEELVTHYLKRKVFSEPLPVSVISHFDVFHTLPWELPGDSKEKMYFFSNRKGHVSGNSTKIFVGSGYWKSIGKDKAIVASNSRQVIGMRKTLIYSKGKLSNETRTQWVMHELCLVGSGATSYPFQMPVANFAVYRIFQKKKLIKTKGYNGKISISRKVENVKPNFIDFTVEYGDDTGPPPPCSPFLSEDSEISSNFKLV
ncbi:hypothetical protein Lal_00038109 [Lupinus albus]|uniref:Putative transcription factor NAM family n=1 Tax=Lupinus albus TaxID=3870 RepID=A0A6A4R340_LUPAL|nr:putative transcription factor NAM family [Lupinus albus]KAF1877800.1 hypothetical protein Lal_00038109 [Lupinus albus]